jgi:archaetidylinositol phosphate synthase
MATSQLISLTDDGVQRPWDARLARRLVTPLVNSWVTPNHLTTVRLLFGLAAAAAFLPGRYGWSNIAAALSMVSNFLDHTDGELARLSGKTSRFGHRYDLASDAAATILLFVAIGAGLDVSAPALSAVPALVFARPLTVLGLPFTTLGAIAGGAVALIFYLRMRIENLAGKSASQQGSMAGFETEDVLYLLPAVTLCGALEPFLLAAAVGAPLFAIWVVIDYRRLLRRLRGSERR